MPHHRIPYRTVRAFFRVLEEYMNEDGYTLCSIGHATERAGLSYNGGRRVMQYLEEMQCIIRYTAQPNGVSARAGRRPQTVTLIKLTGTEPDRQMYRMLTTNYRPRQK